MKKNVYFLLALRIIILFAIAMLFTLVPEYLNKLNPKILGDYVGKYYTEPQSGIRHILLNIMGALLFILSAIDAFMFAYNIVKKNYDS
jgi:hypothetical protein